MTCLLLWIKWARALPAALAAGAGLLSHELHPRPSVTIPLPNRVRPIPFLWFSWVEGLRTTPAQIHLAHTVPVPFLLYRHEHYFSIIELLHLRLSNTNLHHVSLSKTELFLLSLMLLLYIHT